MISYGKWGVYGGQKVFFTLRNPKNGEVWSDDIKRTYYSFEKRRDVTEYGMWVKPENVKWL